MGGYTTPSSRPGRAAARWLGRGVRRGDRRLAANLAEGDAAANVSRAPGGSRRRPGTGDGWVELALRHECGMAWVVRWCAGEAFSWSECVINRGGVPKLRQGQIREWTQLMGTPNWQVEGPS